jgi:hypothetical protein
MASMLARTRALCQSLRFTTAPSTSTFASAFRFVSSAPILSSNDGTGQGKLGDGTTAIVDPEMDNSLREVLAIPVPKPLIPGTFHECESAQEKCSQQ